jgi:hypothetical protein
MTSSILENIHLCLIAIGKKAFRAIGRLGIGSEELRIWLGFLKIDISDLQFS